MAHIFVNGISAKAGGGRSILTNFLSVLSGRRLEHRFTVIVPDAESYARFASSSVTILPMPVEARAALLPVTTEFVLPRLFRRLGCDAMLNFSDLPVPGIRHQVFLFDWPYAAYPESAAWRMGGPAAIMKRRAKLWMFRRHCRDITTFVAQGPALGSRMQRLYGFGRAEIVPNAVSVDNVATPVEHEFGLPGSCKLLCLSHYYSHKNIEALVPVAERIRSAGLDWKLVITIEPSQGSGARRLLDNIAVRGLEKVILNIGRVPMEYVPALYRQTDGLLLPTLLESFSGTYVEAMYHGKPIFTSRLEFAEDVCGEAAFYFDPLNGEDIWRTVEAALRQPALLRQKAEAGHARLARFPSWQQAFDSYISLLERDIEGKE